MRIIYADWSATDVLDPPEMGGVGSTQGDATEYRFRSPKGEAVPATFEAFVTKDALNGDLVYHLINSSFGPGGVDANGRTWDFSLTITAVQWAIQPADYYIEVRNVANADVLYQRKHELGSSPKYAEATPPPLAVIPLSLLSQDGATIGQSPTWDGTTWVPDTGSGSGDMTKAQYATASSTIVDHAYLADAAPWSGITGKPTTLAGFGITDGATTAYVTAQIAALVNSAPGALDTLKELADALGDDANFAATMTTALAGKVPTTRTLTINGTGLDLSADRAWTVTDATLSTSDVTTNNVSTAKHGFAPKAPNDATKYLDGTGAYSVPAGSGGGGTPGGSSGQMQYNLAAAFAGANIYVESANTVGQRNGASPQTFWVYNTYTDASNYERGIFSWSGNVLTIGTESAGTGTVRGLLFAPGNGHASIKGSATSPASLGAETTCAFSALINGADITDLGVVIGLGTTTRRGGPAYHYAGIGGFRANDTDYAGYYSVLVCKADSSIGEAARYDWPLTAGHTSLRLYDLNSGLLKRVKVGANGTGPGGTGRALWIDDA